MTPGSSLCTRRCLAAFLRLLGRIGRAVFFLVVGVQDRRLVEFELGADLLAGRHGCRVRAREGLGSGVGELVVDAFASRGGRGERPGGGARVGATERSDHGPIGAVFCRISLHVGNAGAQAEAACGRVRNDTVDGRLDWAGNLLGGVLGARHPIVGDAGGGLSRDQTFRVLVGAEFAAALVAVFVLEDRRHSQGIPAVAGVLGRRASAKRKSDDTEGQSPKRFNTHVDLSSRKKLSRTCAL
ncbi:MAG: hypothetical protein JWN64_244 [Parcubacteria group bacterium]|nr:hypothetical protein [Parcubacteria group bacterium]